MIYCCRGTEWEINRCPLDGLKIKVWRQILLQRLNLFLVGWKPWFFLRRFHQSYPLKLGRAFLQRRRLQAYCPRQSLLRNVPCVKEWVETAVFAGYKITSDRHGKLKTDYNYVFIQTSLYFRTAAWLPRGNVERKFSKCLMDWKLLESSFPFTKKSRGRLEFLPKRIARRIWRNKQDDNTSQNAERPSRSFAGKNCTFSLCSSRTYVFVRSTHGRDILLDPKPVYKITNVCLRSQDLKEQEFSEQLHQTESLPFSIRVISFFAPRCVLFSYRDQTNFLKLIMRGVFSALFIVALAVLPTQMKGSPKCLVRVSSENELDLL